MDPALTSQIKQMRARAQSMLEDADKAKKEATAFLKVIDGFEEAAKSLSDDEK